MLPPALSPTRNSRVRSARRASQGSADPDRPPEHRPRVVVGRREATLRREVVVHGHGEHAGFGDERVEVPLVRRREGRLRNERAAVVEHEQRQLLRGGGVGQVEADGEPRGGVDGHVLGCHAGGGVDGGRHGVRAHEALDAAALVEHQEGEEEEVDGLVIGCRRGLRSAGGEQRARHVEQEQQRSGDAPSHDQS